MSEIVERDGRKRVEKDRIKDMKKEVSDTKRIR